MSPLTASIALLVTVAALAAAFVTSAAEAAVRSLSPARIRRLRESSTRGSVGLARLADRPSHVGATHALVTGVAAVSVTLAAGAVLSVFPAGLPLWAITVSAAVIGVVLVFGVGEALPRAIVAANAEDLGLLVAPLASSLTSVLYPVARLLSLPSTGMTRLVTGERSPDVPWEDAAEEARSSSDEESPEGGDADGMYDAVSGLESKVVREVMVPRTDMVAIEDTATIVEALAAVTAAGVSRVPVYHDTLDDIRGILYAKDLLPHLANSAAETRPIDLVRPALFVPETKPIEELLREMRRRTHIAIVADEYGGTAGLVTIEDLLEEIVGEIFDEYDPQVPMVTALPDGRVRVDARLAVSELDERFGTDLEDVEADTAGGLFTELAGRIPQVGESVEVQGLRFTVEEMEGNRVRQLLVEPVPKHGNEEDDDE
ncbi:MAG TPA: hemolysin family protein [Coriobacteriia bacterium]